MSSDPGPTAAPWVVDALRRAGCVFAEDEAALLVAAAATPAELSVMVARRAEGFPLEVILGWAAFCGLRVVIEPGVFVPRRRTEFLVEQAVALAAVGTDHSPVVVLDLCCGSAAVGAAVAARLGRVELHAVDIEPAAVRCAEVNVRAAGGRAYLGDLFAPLPGSLRGRVDLLVANAPYVPTAAIALMPPEARLFEPRVALDGGADGLTVQRRAIAAAPPWLAAGGHLLVETGREQASATLAMVVEAGLAGRLAVEDERDATVVIGRRDRCRQPDDEDPPAGDLPAAFPVGLLRPESQAS